RSLRGRAVDAHEGGMPSSRATMAGGKSGLVTTRAVPVARPSADAQSVHHPRSYLGAALVRRAVPPSRGPASRARTRMAARASSRSGAAIGALENGRTLRFAPDFHLRDQLAAGLTTRRRAALAAPVGFVACRDEGPGPQEVAVVNAIAAPNSSTP